MQIMTMYWNPRELWENYKIYTHKIIIYDFCLLSDDFNIKIYA